MKGPRASLTARARKIFIPATLVQPASETRKAIKSKLGRCRCSTRAWQERLVKPSRPFPAKPRRRCKPLWGKQ
eukprot:11176889-Lingulodinium_polyedra.AAC.1